VIGGGDDGIRPPHGAVVLLEPFERLRARHLVDDVTIDIDEAGAVGLLANEVGIPELLIEGACHGQIISGWRGTTGRYVA
jgi:hypothetical protein